MNDLVTNPFESGRPSGALAETAGSRQMMARENTEVMAMVAMAKRYPRDVIACTDRIRNAFTRPTLAEKSQYQFARGGQDITGPSIRAAEAIAQQWGNMSAGWRELSRSVGPDGVGISEVEAYCVDYETNGREAIQFFVRHWRDTKSGGYKLKDERDIYELSANQAQRRKRACILAQVPGDVTEMAMEQAAVTLKSKADTSPEAMVKMVDAFAEFGVTKAHIEKRIQRRIESIQAAQVVAMKRIYASLRDEMSEPSDWFEIEAPTGGTEADGGTEKPPTTTLAGVAAAHKSKGKNTGVGKPDPAAGDSGAPPKKTFDQFKANLEKAGSQDIADLEMDEAKDTLNESENEDLAKLYRARFPRT
jgi:hypothetical protein